MPIIPRVLLPVLLLAAAVSAQAATGPYGDAWDWRLAPRKFGALSQGERVQYTRAEDMFRQGNYEAAAIEFEKYVTQNPKSSVYSHCLLMQAYSLHLARQRNKAISLYGELLDFFADDVEEAAPASFLKGQAQIENGDPAGGYRTLKTMVEHEKYLENPISDVALNQLALNYLANKDEKGAENCWKKVDELFSAAFVRPEDAVKEARHSLIDLYISQKRPAAAEDLLTKGSANARTVCEAATNTFERALAVFGKVSKDARSEYYHWFTGKKAAFAEAQRLDDYFGRALALAQRTGVAQEWRDLFKQALEYARGLADAKKPLCYGTLAARLVEAGGSAWNVQEEWRSLGASVMGDGKGLPADRQLALYMPVMDAMRIKIDAGSAPAVLWDPLVARCTEIYASLQGGEKDVGLAQLVDRIKVAGQTQRAFDVADKIGDPALAQWKRVELYDYEQKYTEMAKACEELEPMDNKEYATRALRTRAGLYKDRLNRLEDAIKLYNEINDPPGTAWAIVDCYERLGKLQQAVATCTEIENFFENEAPSAAFRRAQIWDRAGEKKKAIAECRAVLKKYPKHQVSSQAHQMLERYGIATGGGVTDEDQ